MTSFNHFNERKNLIKARIVSQLKDPNSAIRYLMCIKTSRRRFAHNHQLVHPDSPFVNHPIQVNNTIKTNRHFYVSELDFGIKVDAIRDMETAAQKGKHDYQYYELMHVQDSPNDYEIDLSNLDSIESYRFYEEELSLSGEIMTLGVREFYLTHCDYVFQKVVVNPEELIGEVKLNFKDSTSNIMLLHAENKWCEISNRCLMKKDKETYLAHYISEAKRREIRDFLKASGLKEEIKDLIQCFKVDTQGHEPKGLIANISGIDRYTWKRP